MRNADCNAVYGIVGDGVVCIDTAGGRGSCNGDSGGPLVQKGGKWIKAVGDKWIQVGIVSFGASAGCEVGMPAGFTRTEYYLDWIKSGLGCLEDVLAALHSPRKYLKIKDLLYDPE